MSTRNPDDNIDWSLTTWKGSRASQLRDWAIRDPLTGIFNRRHFDETARRLIPRLRHNGEPLGLILVDIDSFKEINDRHGHDVGDRALQLVGQMLRDAIRPTDLPCRLGGDEFVVALPGASGAATAARAEALRASLAAQSVQANGASVTVSASFGVAVLTGAGDTLQAALRRADQALYEAKRAGRNRVRHETPAECR